MAICKTRRERRGNLRGVLRFEKCLACLPRQSAQRDGGSLSKGSSASAVSQSPGIERYTPTTCFETFPMPWPPGQEPASDPRCPAMTTCDVCGCECTPIVVQGFLVMKATVYVETSIFSFYL
jgi:hypothetical protein